jgi:DNA-binding NtrC family response regulator
MNDGAALGRPRSVAIVEDDPDIRWLLEELADGEGFEVQMYAAYDEALIRLATRPVSAISADRVDCGYKTPTESGRARIAELASDAPAILHTARPWARRQRRWECRHCSGHLREKRHVLRLDTYGF